MIRVSDKSQCCGCTSCVNACPVQCIVMRRDKEGFDYPVANPDICIGCGKCESVCPVLEPLSETEPVGAYAARNPRYVEGSSSGGVFPALAESIFKDGGVVFGAVINNDMTVGHTEAETMAEVEAMRGSKYVQSDLYSVFEETRAYLRNGRKVLFTGTPCQIAGLHKYLDKEYAGLLTVDIACHGVPSPGLWQMYVNALEGKNGRQMTSVCFKDKSESWRHYSFVTSFDRKEYMKDPFMALFVQGMTLRPSCYECPASGGKSNSDITLSDLWSVADVAPQMNDDRGVSGVYVNTEKGREAFLSCGLEYTVVDVRESRRNNGGFISERSMPERREEFFRNIHSASDLLKYMASFVVRKPAHVRLYRWLRRKLSALKKRFVK